MGIPALFATCIKTLYKPEAGSDDRGWENAMTTIIGISGSLRAQSFNTALLRTAATLMPQGGARLDIASIRGIPLYERKNQDTI